MADIRIRQLPDGSGPVATDYIPVDNGSTRRATIQNVVEIGRPAASQAEAEAGTNPTKVMTPLTTKQAVTFYGLLKANNLNDIASASAARTNLGLAIGTDVQAFDAALASIAGLTTAADQMIYTTAPDTYATTALTPFGRSILDDANAGAVRTTLGLGDSATRNVGTTAGTVAAGDDSRIVNAVQTARAVNTGTGLTGGGDLSADRTIALNAASIASLALADSALQPATGKTSFQTKALAQAATIPAAVKRISFQFLNPTYTSLATLVGGGEYKRASLADLGSYPASSYFRTVDRFMPDGTTDNTNGGYWLLDEARPDPLQFGAIGDATTNDRQAIIDAGVYANQRVGGVGGVVEFSSGIGHFWDSPISLPNGLSWISRVQTPMKYNGGGAAVTMFGNDATIDGFRFTYTGTFGVGNIVCIQIGIAELAQRQVIRNNVFFNFGTAIHHKTAVGATISGNIINTCSLYGILFENTTNADAGDAGVYNNIISNAGQPAGTGDAAFYYVSGGGLRFQFNKVLDFKRGFDMQIADGVSTVDLMFTGNSIENQQITAMRLSRAGTTGVFGSITITGNEFGGAPTGLEITSGAYNGSLTTNVFNVISTTAILLSGNTSNWQISDNNFSACAMDITDNRSDNDAEPILTNVKSGVRVTSTTTYSYYSQVTVPAFRSAKVRIFVEGILQGAGFVSRNYDFMLSHNGTTLVLTPISNTTATDSVALDLDVDLTTTAGSARIGFRRNAAAGGSGTFDGAYSAAVEGRIGSIVRLQ